MEPRQESTSMIIVDHQSALAIDPKARLPFSVMLLWLCAFADLAVYAASWYVPSLAQIGH
jgi:hypothetical protein